MPVHAGLIPTDPVSVFMSWAAVLQGAQRTKSWMRKKDSAGFSEDKGRLLKFNYCWMGRES